jgi:transcriptional regulator with XRE-family HTH domain
MVSIKRARKARGFSLSDVADRANLHREAVARAERDGQDPRASTVLAIARALGAPVCELYGETGHGTRTSERGVRQARKRPRAKED